MLKTIRPPSWTPSWSRSDSPPLLRVGHARPLTSHVDGLLILGSLLVLFFIKLSPAHRLVRELSELRAGLPSPGGAA